MSLELQERGMNMSDVMQGSAGALGSFPLNFFLPAIKRLFPAFCAPL